MPKVFSCPSMSFDHVPADSELTCLLGDSGCGPIKAVENEESLTVRPWQFPMKYMVPWGIFVMVVISCMSYFMEGGNLDLLVWLMLLFGWLVCLPGTLAVMVVINRAFGKKGDHFRVNMSRRTLELCRIGRTVTASEIIAITLLGRWYRHGAWEKTYQTGVLVRTRDKVEFYPLVRESGENVPASKRSKWADRLADIFQAPVRRIELSKSESRALNDC
jgi:hypothetical protein